MVTTNNLGQHRADFDEEQGSLTLYDDRSLMTLSPDETYQLLMWLSDNYRERLQQLAEQKPEQGRQSKQRLGIDAEDVNERAHEDWSNDE